MGLVIREGIGWFLVAIGLLLIGVLLYLALQRNVLETLALSFPATILFRSGMSLVRHINRRADRDRH